MNLSSPVPTKSDDGLEVLREDGERVCCRKRRLNADGELENVLIVTLTAEHPKAASLDRLAHEYALKDELDGAWVVRPLALIRERGRTMLTLEYSASGPLDRLLGMPTELGHFLCPASAGGSGLGASQPCLARSPKRHPCPDPEGRERDR
jgi:hypothetical protein